MRKFGKKGVLLFLICAMIIILGACGGQKSNIGVQQLDIHKDFTFIEEIKEGIDQSLITPDVRVYLRLKHPKYGEIDIGATQDEQFWLTNGAGMPYVDSYKDLFHYAYLLEKAQKILIPIPFSKQKGVQEVTNYIYDIRTKQGKFENACIGMSDFERVDGNSVKSTLSTGDEMEKCYGCSARTVEYTGYCDLAQYEKGAYDAYYYYENLVRKTDFADSEQVRKWEREMLQAWVEMLSRGDWEQYQKVQTIAGKKWIQNTYGNSLDSIGITSAKLDNIEDQGQHAYQITVKYQGCNDRDIWPFCEEDDETFEEQIIGRVKFMVVEGKIMLNTDDSHFDLEQYQGISNSTSELALLQDFSPLERGEFNVNCTPDQSGDDMQWSTYISFNHGELSPGYSHEDPVAKCKKLSKIHQTAKKEWICDKLVFGQRMSTKKACSLMRKDGERTSSDSVDEDPKKNSLFFPKDWEEYSELDIGDRGYDYLELAYVEDPLASEMQYFPVVDGYPVMHKLGEDTALYMKDDDSLFLFEAPRSCDVDMFIHSENIRDYYQHLDRIAQGEHSSALRECHLSPR